MQHLSPTEGVEYSNAFLVADFHAFRVATTLPCRRCRYDLRGLTADGHCPECGLEVLDTVALRVDPELALLPALASPRWAGTSLLVLAASLACAVLGTSATAATLILSRLPRTGWHSPLHQFFPPTVPERLFLVPPLALLIATASSLALLATCGVGGRLRFLLPGGLFAWSVAAWFTPDVQHLAMVGVIAAVTLIGLSPVIRQLGPRSRAYRHASHAQQAIGPLIASIVIGVVSVLIAEIGARILGSDVGHFLRLNGVVCLAMTNVGFIYLVTNAAWIWRSLWLWQPLLERVLVEGGRERAP